MKVEKKRFALDLSRYALRISRHAQRMANEKNFSLETIEKTYNDPERVYPSGSHPGQYRVTGHGLCLVGVPEEMSNPKPNPTVPRTPISIPSSNNGHVGVPIKIPGQDNENESLHVTDLHVRGCGPRSGPG